MRSQKFFSLASFVLALAVILGAFGSHALSQLLEQNNRVSTWDTASKYHFYHGIGLFIIGYLYRKTGAKPVYLCFYLMIIGIAIFSGTLYLLCLTNYTLLGAITPIGGLFLIASWVLLGWSLWIFKKVD